MNSVKKFGPFTPQEFDKISNWLEKNQLQFKLIKDENTEKEFQENSPANLVAQVEFRTKVYLAQIFSVEVENMNFDQERAFNQEFKLIESVPSRFLENQKNEVPDISSLNEKAEKNNRTKRIWARVAVMILIYLAMPKLIQLFHAIANQFKN